ncbi:MAG: PorP/SprF family type IX secretion system membrane protein [bacterium]|nr:PorP/SprF family type IX secretion system membrane protein [bacterium]MDD6832146.1 PorP/SprF family type IX secretion system membrane protein [bacterium]MDY4184878.1 PorP/SprF family type IX secretion system membrane protein [Sodaliphilus sp.]
MKTGWSKYVLMMLVAWVSVPTLKAQVDNQYTQYYMVPGYYNPSAIGNTDYIHITLGSRAQWVGIKHAPLSFVGLADMPFKFLNKRFATGVSINQTSMGLYSGLNASAQLAYKHRLFGGTLSGGFQVGLVNEKFKGSEIIEIGGEEADDAIPKTDVSGNALDLGVGLHYQHKYWWAGISATHLTEPSVEMKAEGNEEDLYIFEAGRTYYFMAGGNIPIKNTLFELQPSVFVKTDFNLFQAEATMRVRYNKFITGGVAYRHNDAVSLVAGVEIKNFVVGYSYDYPISDISKATSGSHEVFVNYNVKLNLGEKNKNKHKSIRLM